jgi:hypothetical protein
MHTVRSLGALALMAAVASSPLSSQDAARARRGSEFGTLLTWTPAADLAVYNVDGQSRSTLRYGSLSVLAHAGDWSSAYLTSQSALFGRVASERSLRFTREVFWVDLDEVGALIDQFAAANQQVTSRGGGFWSAAGDAWTPRSENPASDWPRLFGGDLQNESLPPRVNVPRLTLDQPLFAPTDEPVALEVAAITTVPEPSTYMLMAGGLLIIVVLARLRPERARRRI